MADIRQLLRSGIDGQSKRQQWVMILTLLSIATVLGTIPVLIIGLGPVVISTGVLAGVFLLARQYGVFSR